MEKIGAVHKLIHGKRSIGEKSADGLAKWAGSWTFIIGFLVFLGLWMLVNVYAWINTWDPYPFILLNLCLSCLATYQAPIILMAQNRSAERDRHQAERDYAVNRKSEREVENMQQDLDDIKVLVKELHVWLIEEKKCKVKK